MFGTPCTKYKPVLTGCFYRASNSDVKVLNNIETSIDPTFDSGLKDFLITRDFNLDLLRKEILHENDISRQNY